MRYCAEAPTSSIAMNANHPGAAREGGNMRVQLALNVSDLDEAVDFYSRMFGVEPVKTMPGYANFAIADPPLKLVLFEGEGQGGTINHLGVEAETAEEVRAAEARLTEGDLQTTGVVDTQCCYATKTETWVTGPDDARWEWYVKTGDSEQFADLLVSPIWRPTRKADRRGRKSR
jgi:catechol 2,3-dioxygenase-like lactoylglutathione lyase family enzyme